MNNREVSSYLKVVGEGVISVKPDQAAISLGVITERKSLQNAQQTNAKMTSQVLSALRNLQIPNENIQTTTFRINMQYDYKDGDQIFRGYRVTNIVRVTVNDINQVGLVVDTAVENGANTVNDIELMVSDSAPYQQQALSKAIQNAQVKANTVRQTTGLSIQTIPYKVKEIRFQETDRPKTMVLGVATESPATPVEPGIIDIRSVVEAKFLIT
ncbi:SIMPL domain-containing protein [Salinibacillus kushneri]|uniref:SIMPL domain-containing protein n=1 Tax=Salinibacillus kushneri TaxID=237682 RepID=UPI0015A51273|nr:SIMPL domain-containing protein [Salinibacillus kushneri]